MSLVIIDKDKSGYTARIYAILRPSRNNCITHSRIHENF